MRKQLARPKENLLRALKRSAEPIDATVGPAAAACGGRGGRFVGGPGLGRAPGDSDMAILPSADIKKLEFTEAHVAVWTANAVAVGLTAAQVGAIDTAAKASPP